MPSRKREMTENSRGLKMALLGPPGAGKGTQAMRLADRVGVARVAPGELFRKHQKKETELGLLARGYMERGVLVPDDVTIRMVMEWIGHLGPGDGFLLDGFPRTLAQARALDGKLEDDGGIDKVLHIKVNQEELIRRLTGRLLCRDCQTPYHLESSQPGKPGTCDRCGGELYQREDDRPEAVGKRIEVYFAETEPLVDYYMRACKLKEIHGEGTIEEVGQAMMEAVG